MEIRHCAVQDVDQINDLMKRVGFGPVHPMMMEDTTIGVFESSRCLGFVWASVSESKWIAYVDYLAVDPETRGIGNRLTQGIWNHLASLGVQKVMSTVAYSGTDSEEKSLHLQAKLGMLPMAKPYHLCVGDIERGRSWAV